ncbi:PAB-dependent poly(A)-specific ribonuclease subunit 3 [Wickerhamomyces ciferrii]|uniref:PAN2-PAN3 deadenylation complex subunit PAN3 n=1 Tax=Wickerhamomyces ciferrii (strain ATCC 14091 / BCRC 22168 / CBS 111 / JCM 3599 / NBRC 0793 / NRRL Y-1031 F-60-10) TaxID=1206466 RepID=K0KU93_WICCF|nr:PAB-dependent poly(A)-specific ribonuclease subunit 3 [Wickerhamomyces ciferrii]CCH44758.1 PAB-dependent poly(A)-specific ribonuclease subunit 3 [Wickerhamomyces ciferrii]
MEIRPYWAKDVPCRNITIHGFCKFEGKGCSFKHESSNKSSTITSNSNINTSATSLPLQQPLDPLKNPSIGDFPTISSRPTSALSNNIPNSGILNSASIGGSITSGTNAGTGGDLKKKFNPASSSTFLPSTSISNVPNLSNPTKPINKFAGFSPKVNDIPSFIPSGTTINNNDDLTSTQNGLKQFNLDSPVFQPTTTTNNNNDIQPSINRSPIPTNPYLVSNNDSIQPNPYAQSSEALNPYSQVTGPQDFLFPQTSYPLNHHLYAPAPPPHLQIPLKGNEENSSKFFLPNELRESLIKKNESTLKTLQHSNLPELVNIYYNLVPLDNSLQKSNQTYGYYSSLYKAFSNDDGKAYVLRRIENVKLNQDKSISTIKKWVKLNCSNITKIIDAFTSRSFGDNSLIIVYDYYPNSKNLIEQHFHSNLGAKPEQITPKILWNYTLQLTNAIATSHSKNLPIRSLTLTKIIVTSLNRIRLSDCGIFDILDFEDFSNEDEELETINLLKIQDLQKLGQLLLSLAISSSPNSSKFSNNEDIISNIDIDEDFKSALKYLLNESNPNIESFQKIISKKLFESLNQIQEQGDYYESQLTRELENGRLVRLLTKLNFILERPEYQSNPTWAQSGERYPIKLFREYVFNQVDDRGKPVLDLAFVLKTLNKLDAGIDEKFLLVSHDEQTCMIVSYKEMRDLIERSFRELSN